MEGRYGARVRELLARLAHAGDPATGPGAVWVGEAAAPDRGAWVRFAVRVRDGVVEEARFRAWGCPEVLAACELAASRLEGLGIDRHGLSGAELARVLQSPPEKLGRLLVVEDALATLAAAPGASK